MRIAANNEETMEKICNTFDLLQAQIRDQHSQLQTYIETSMEALQRDVGLKADKKGTLNNFEMLNDALGSLSKEMLLKANCAELV